ncbi:hypothetical protein IQ07DRAFT_686153 [Pyrenochaeta sp. DS3sAY3a]|nr:hypothetical protein IQ07DRAFT_686153 [Pyrenochaeta sp. DS3sAY3a]
MRENTVNYHDIEHVLSLTISMISVKFFLQNVEACAQKHFLADFSRHDFNGFEEAAKLHSKCKVQGRFDSDELARSVREVIIQQELLEDALLKDDPDAACEVFVCATSKETSETVCLTSYRTARGNNDLLNSGKILEACRVTSAATSFDPIAIGRFSEDFVGGATGANNAVREVWDQAQQVWGPEVESKIKCVVLIGTGVQSLKPFNADVLHVGETLVGIATEMEQTAERFRRKQQLLDSTGRYYRFNVVRGLEDIGLEGAKKVKEMAAATRRYMGSQEAHKQIQTCAGNVASREYFGIYRINFSLEDVPRMRLFVDRPAEMAAIERALLPQRTQPQRQKVSTLRGLGGIGKTQLVVDEDSIKRSIASCASRVPQGQIPETGRAYVKDGGADVDEVARDVLAWLARADNTAWLLIIDNVDHEHSPRSDDPEAFDMKQYLSDADHGCVLITTRQARLQQLGSAHQLGKSGSDAAQGQQLPELLDGLPLAIAQAGAFLQESGVGLEAYLQTYKQQWDELMAPSALDEVLQQDYADCSV